MRRYRWILGFVLFFLFLTHPQAVVDGAQRAMRQWYETVAPSLFPFMVLMPLLTCEEAVQAYEVLLGGVMKKLFRLPGAAAPALVVGLVAGSPAGAVTARRVAARSGMDQGQLQRLACAACGFSPAFLLSGVGAGMLGDAGLGCVLFRAQLITQLLLALLLRRAWRGRRAAVPPLKEDVVEQPVRGAVLSIVNVCGYMVFFSALAGVFQDIVGARAGDALLCLLDVPSGAKRISEMSVPLELRVVVLAAMIGFGGVCVNAQNLSVLRGCGVWMWEFVGIRLVAAGLCALCTALQMNVPHLEIDNSAISGKTLPVAALCAVIVAIPAVVRLLSSVAAERDGRTI